MGLCFTKKHVFSDKIMAEDGGLDTRDKYTPYSIAKEIFLRISL